MPDEGTAFRIQMAIAPMWDSIHAVLSKAKKYLAVTEGDTDFINAVVMCISELLENAIKYGTEGTSEQNVDFDMILDDREVMLRVSNGIQNPQDLERACQYIDELNSAPDLQQAYSDRLRSLAENPVPGTSRLGLYRIAFEGQFKTHWAFENGVFTITARRPIPHP